MAGKQPVKGPDVDAIFSDIVNYDQDHWISFARDPESFPMLDLEELFAIQSKSLDPNGVWDPAILIDGSRRSGKSVLAKDICIEAHRRGLIGRITVITGTKQNRFWHDLVPYSMIHSVENAREALQHLVATQEYLVEEFKDGNDVDCGTFQHTIILDDFIGDQKFSRYSSELITAFTNFRHTGCCVIAITQFPTGVPPTVRSNADFAFVFLQQSESQSEKIISDHLSFIRDKKVAYALLNNVPREFRCISIHKTDPYLTPMEKVKWFKAKDWDSEAGGHSTIRVGCQVWRDKVAVEDEKLLEKNRRDRKAGGAPKIKNKYIENGMQSVDDLKQSLQNIYNIKI